MLLFIEKLAKYTYTKEWKKRTKVKCGWRSWNKFLYGTARSMKKCGTRDYILIFFIQFSIFWEHQHQIWEEKKSEALEKKYRKMKKAANCHTFIDFCLSRALWHSQLILYLRSTHILSRSFFLSRFPSNPFHHTHIFFTLLFLLLLYLQNKF